MVIVWRITERCNLSCKFCSYDRQLSRVRRDANPKSLMAFGQVLSQYQELTGDQVLVSWLGGEPLLWQPLAEITAAFSSWYGLRLSTTTNGTLLGSPAVRNHLLEHYSELTISVDGIGGLHEMVRGWPGGYSTLRRSVMALSEEKRKGGHQLRLRANVVLMRNNVADFERLCEELSGWGIEEVTFNQLGGNDRPEFYPQNRLLPEQTDWLISELPSMRSRLAVRGLQINGGNGYLRRLQATANGERLPIVDCRPGQSFLFINEDGYIAPCSFTTAGYGVSINEIDSVDTLRQLPARFSEARLRRRLVSCEDCHSTQVFEKFAA